MEETYKICYWDDVNGCQAERDATEEEIAEIEARKEAAANYKYVPQSVTMRQARLALLQAGKLGDVEGAINSLPSPQKEAAQIEWQYSSEVFRNRPLVQALGPLLNLSEDELDSLFILAETL